MPSIDLSKLAEILSDSKSGEDEAYVHHKIDKLLLNKNPGGWTQSMIAIVSLCTLIILLCGVGLTGYLNLREPLHSVIADIKRHKTDDLILLERVRLSEIKSEHIEDHMDKYEIKSQYFDERTIARLNKIEKFIGKAHGMVLLDGS